MKKFLSSSVFILGFILFYSAVYADVPNEIVYQGRLKEYGQPVNGTRDITFKIYNDNGTVGHSGTQQGGNMEFTNVNVSSGVFSCVLNPNVDWRGKDYWIEITVNSKILSPREKITAQAYALHSRSAEDIRKNSDIEFAINSSTVAKLTSGGYLLINGVNVVPVGSILPYGGASAPAGWLLCDGKAYSQSGTYNNLYNVIGTSFGNGTTGTGGTTGDFNVPDLRGRFIRGWDNGVGRDPDKVSRTAMNTGGNPGDSIGSVQTSNFASHTHVVYYDYVSSPSPPDNTGRNSISGLSNTVVYDAAAARGHEVCNKFTLENQGGNETRPINAYVNYIIKH